MRLDWLFFLSATRHRLILYRFFSMTFPRSFSSLSASFDFSLSAVAFGRGCCLSFSVFRGLFLLGKRVLGLQVSILSALEATFIVNIVSSPKRIFWRGPLRSLDVAYASISNVCSFLFCGASLEIWVKFILSSLWNNNVATIYATSTSGGIFLILIRDVLRLRYNGESATCSFFSYGKPTAN